MDILTFLPVSASTFQEIVTKFFGLGLKSVHASVVARSNGGIGSILESVHGGGVSEERALTVGKALANS